jgi:hypothetical protein
LSIGATVQMVNFSVNSELLKTLIFSLNFCDITPYPLKKMVTLWLELSRA